MGFVDNPGIKPDLVKIFDDEKSVKKVVSIITEKLKDKREGVFVATNLIESVVEHVNKLPSMYSESDKTVFSITKAEFLRKQGFVAKSKELLMHAYYQILKVKELKSSFFPKFNSVSPRQLCYTLLINAATCSMQLGLFQHCIDTVDGMVFQQDDIIDTYHFSCAQSLTSSALACKGSFTAALEKAKLCHDNLAAKLPRSHIFLAITYNQLGVMLAANNKFEAANLNFERALDVIKSTTGHKSIQSLITQFNKVLVENAKANKMDQNQLQQHLVIICSMLPDKHHLRNTMSTENLAAEFKTLDLHDFIWKFSFVSLLDHPFSWIDYPPTSTAVVFGADYQVWAHLDQLLHLHSWRYAWISSIFLGSFHKLANLHEKLMKRYGKFHLEKHAAAFLDNPSASKVQYLLSMKDFDASNQFYYHDVIAGITELLLAVLKH